MSEEERARIAREIAPKHWDMGPAAFRDELRALLRTTLADQGTSIDTGGGDGMADLWVTCGGVEFFITIRKSNGQIAREGK